MRSWISLPVYILQYDSRIGASLAAFFTHIISKTNQFDYANEVPEEIIHAWKKATRWRQRH
jgi:hypothetical protein